MERKLERNVETLYKYNAVGKIESAAQNGAEIFFCKYDGSGRINEIFFDKKKMRFSFDYKPKTVAVTVCNARNEIIRSEVPLDVVERQFRKMTTE